MMMFIFVHIDGFVYHMRGRCYSIVHQRQDDFLRCVWDSISTYFHRNNMGKKIYKLQHGSPITVRFRLYCSYSITPFE